MKLVIIYALNQAAVGYEAADRIPHIPSGLEVSL